MLNYFKKRKQEKERLEQFRKKIKGMFDDWKLDGNVVIKGPYRFWASTSFKRGEVSDYKGQAPFISLFTPTERELLYQEIYNLRQARENKVFLDSRRAINEEFNLSGDGLGKNTKEHLEDFKQRLKGLFDSWKVSTDRVITNGKYSLIFKNSFSDLRDDWGGTDKHLLEFFNKEEIELIRLEILTRLDKERGALLISGRESINKEFNLI